MPRPEAEGRPLALASLVSIAAFATLLSFAPLYRATLWVEAPNEGWNALHTLVAFSRDFYPPRSALMLNNYTPLWGYLTGALDAVFGDPIFPARVLDFAAFLGVAGGVFAVSRRLGVSVHAALIGALGFVLIVAALYSNYVAADEPQMLAHALATAAAAIVLGARSRRAIAAAALLTVTALLVKQVVVGLPIACTLWLALRRPPLLATWIAVGAVAGAATLAAILAVYGGAFVQNIAAPRYLTLARFATNLGGLWRAAVGLVAFGAVLPPLRRRLDDQLWFVALAIGGGILVIFAFGGAMGVSNNIAFDLLIASSIGLSVGWERAAEAFGARWTTAWRLVLVVGLLARAGFGAGPDAWALPFEPAARAKVRTISDHDRAVIARLAALKGPVICEGLALCAWAGHQSGADLFKFINERTLAFMDTAPMLARVSAGQYAAVVPWKPMTRPTADGDLPGFGAALAKGYLPPVVYPDAGSLYLPKPKP